MQKQKTRVVYRYRTVKKPKLSKQIKGFWKELKVIAGSPTAKHAVKLLARAGKRSSEGSSLPFHHPQEE